MSVQFGRWNFEGQPPAPEYIERVSATLAPYGPDSNERYSKDGVTILYCAFHTTKESYRETQPHISLSGAVITWDGRLDNRSELISQVRDSLTASSTDVAIVAAAYEMWGTYSFAKLIGDWALSIWNPVTHSLILAKDPIGTKHLYYLMEKDHVTWSTILDPLVLFARKTFTICEEYIAGWLSCFPAAQLTPYVGIHAVPPSSSVLLRPGKRTVSKYWDFNPGKRIRYRSDAEYEEHFRAVFAKAVQRRLRSDRRILAELSGGIDSASIVCMADLVIARGATETPRLDTISWYNDSDPDDDELNYLTKVEEKRGSTGYHIDLACLKETTPRILSESQVENNRFAVTPESNKNLTMDSKQYAEHMRSQEYRVTLSGIGGEQATGGFVPTPRPELQNLLARARFLTLARQLNAWAVKMRKPRLRLLWKAIRGFFACDLTVTGAPEDIRLAPWLATGFVRRNRAALGYYASRVKLFGPLPSFQEHIHELNTIRRFLASSGLHSEWLREIRLPYLDRDLLEFAYLIPREQLVRVGQRRSLMKRALVGIVPDEVLNRKRKAPLQQTAPKPEKDNPTERSSLMEMGQSMVGSFIGIIDPSRFAEELQRCGCNEGIYVGDPKRTLLLESWLRHLKIQGLLTGSISTEKQSCSLPPKAKGTPNADSAQEFS